MRPLLIMTFSMFLSTSALAKCYCKINYCLDHNSETFFCGYTAMKKPDYSESEDYGTPFKLGFRTKYRECRKIIKTDSRCKPDDQRSFW